MATLDQLGSALKKAAAAGDEPAARALAKAYKAMAAQQSSGESVPPSPAVASAQAVSGGVAPIAQNNQDQKVYAESAPLRNIPIFGSLVEAATNPALKQALRPVTDAANSFQHGAMQGMTLGFGDEINAGLATPLNVAQQAVTGKPIDPGAAFNSALDQGRALDQGAARLNPTANLAGEITGGFVGPGKGGSLLKDAAAGALYGFGSSDGDLKDRAVGAATGGIVGGILGKVIPGLVKAGGKTVENVLQKRATDAAIKNAPSGDDLSSVASGLFKSAKSSGVGVTPQKFGQVAHDLASDAMAKDIDKDLDAPAWTVYERVVQLAKDGFNDPSALSLSRLHNLRQKAQDVVMDPASKNRTKTFAQDVVDGIDNMIHTLKPSDMTGPKNLLGNGKLAGNTLLDGIATWAKAKKVGLLESAMKSAENYATGKESGLRLQFKSLLNGAKTKNLWTPVERKAMQEVINGGPVVVGLRTLGMFKGFASAGVGGALGSVLGPWGSAAGTALGGAAGLAARKVTENAATKSAERAAKIVATPHIPQVTVNHPLMALPGAPFTLPVIDQTRQPVRITVRGSGQGPSAPLPR